MKKFLIIVLVMFMSLSAQVIISEDHAGILSKGDLVTTTVISSVDTNWAIMLGYTLDTYSVVYSFDSSDFKMVKYLIAKSGSENEDLEKPSFNGTVIYKDGTSPASYEVCKLHINEVTYNDVWLLEICPTTEDNILPSIVFDKKGAIKFYSYLTSFK